MWTYLILNNTADKADFGCRIEHVTVSDYTGPRNDTEVHSLDGLHLDIQTYVLQRQSKPDSKRKFGHGSDNEDTAQACILPLPHTTLKDDWNTLVYDEDIPSRLLRFLCRMLLLMKQPDLNVSYFNWNRLCLLHGPPGGGKSTLCRALAQKLSIRLGDTFPQTLLVEIDTNSMLSKYFGESGKLISSLFQRIQAMAAVPSTLICVVIDEVETIAGSRQKASGSGECNDGIRVCMKSHPFE